MQYLYISQLLLSIALIVFISKRSLLFLHFFQQEQYYQIPFLKGVFSKFKVVDKKLTLSLLVLGIVLFFIKDNNFQYIAGSVVATILLIAFTFKENDPRKQAKKALVMTARVKRILVVSIILMIALISVAICLAGMSDNFAYTILAAIFTIQVLPIVVVVGNFLLKPVEAYIRNGYVKEAKAILAEVNPKIIGVTGSYGKTSTKLILNHLLSALTPTLATPGSVNTLMGVTRIIREKLKPEHRFFIVEMGAYKVGGIKQKCDFAPPDFGVITAVGDAHLERFGSFENIGKAKFELANAVFKRGGKIAVNGDLIKEEFIDKYCEGFYDSVSLLNSSENDDNLIKDKWLLSKVEQKKEGLYFELKYNKNNYKVQTPLYGEHHASNVALAFIIAVKIGVPTDTLIAAARTIPQITHRLEVKSLPNGTTLIDDAFNSNPVGFTAALNILGILGDKKSRKFIVTPGMVEMGERHDEEHFKVGKIAGDNVDFALIVHPERIPTFINGFNEGNKKGKQLLTFASFTEAREWLDKNMKAGDVVLYENDLPDLYEMKVNI